MANGSSNGDTRRPDGNARAARTINTGGLANHAGRDLGTILDARKRLTLETTAEGEGTK